MFGEHQIFSKTKSYWRVDAWLWFVQAGIVRRTWSLWYLHLAWCLTELLKIKFGHNLQSFTSICSSGSLRFSSWSRAKFVIALNIINVMWTYFRPQLDLTNVLFQLFMIFELRIENPSKLIILYMHINRHHPWTVVLWFFKRHRIVLFTSFVIDAAGAANYVFGSGTRWFVRAAANTHYFFNWKILINVKKND